MHSAEDENGATEFHGFMSNRVETDSKQGVQRTFLVVRLAVVASSWRVVCRVMEEPTPTQ